MMLLLLLMLGFVILVNQICVHNFATFSNLDKFVQICEAEVGEPLVTL